MGWGTGKAGDPKESKIGCTCEQCDLSGRRCPSERILWPIHAVLRCCSTWKKRNEHRLVEKEWRRRREREREKGRMRLREREREHANEEKRERERERQT